MSDDLIGKVFKNDKYGEFKVTQFSHKDNNRCKYYKIEFISSGYVAVRQAWGIKNGIIKDRLAPTVAGVGKIGYSMHKENPRAYSVWSSMLERCYKKKHNRFEQYGKVGVRVCERWKRFDYFLEDLPKIDRYDEEKFKNGELELDKDLKQGSMKPQNKIYSLNTTTFLTSEENNSLRNTQQRNFKAVSPKGDIFYSYNQKLFAEKHNLIHSCVNKCLNEHRQTHKGWKFEFIE